MNNNNLILCLLKRTRRNKLLKVSWFDSKQRERKREREKTAQLSAWAFVMRASFFCFFFFSLSLLVLSQFKFVWACNMRVSFISFCNLFMHSNSLLLIDCWNAHTNTRIQATRIQQQQQHWSNVRWTWLLSMRQEEEEKNVFFSCFSKAETANLACYWQHSITIRLLFALASPAKRLLTMFDGAITHLCWAHTKRAFSTIDKVALIQLTLTAHTQHTHAQL